MRRWMSHLGLSWIGLDVMMVIVRLGRCEVVEFWG